MSRFIFILLAAICFAGCGHNAYRESETTGLSFDIPIGDDHIGLSIGSTKTVTAVVRGGSTFETTTANGGGLLSGNVGQAKVSRLKTPNTQINEGYLADVLMSTNVPVDVKLELAKHIPNAKSEDFQDSILQTKTATIHLGSEAIISNNVESIGLSGGDLLVDKTFGTIDNVVTNSVVNDLVKLPSEVTSDIAHIADDAEQAVSEVADTTRSVMRLLVFIVLIICTVCIISIFKDVLAARQNKPKPTTPASPPSDTPTSESEVTQEVTTSPPNKPSPKQGFFAKLFLWIKIAIGWIMLIPPPVRAKIVDFFKTKYKSWQEKRSKKK